MKFLSSIFSSDTLQIHVWCPRSVILATGLLLALDWGVSRPDWLHRCFPNSYVGTFLKQERLLRNCSHDPEIVIIGNSRASGLDPAVLERELQLPAGAAFCFSIAAGDPYDGVLAERRNRDRLGRARLIIFCIDSWQFDSTLPLSSKRFIHFASLRDRWRAGHRWDVLVGGFWRTYDQEDLFQGVAKQILSSALHKEAPVQWRRTQRETVRDTRTAAEMAHRYFRDYQLSTVMRDFLALLINQVSPEGQKIMLVQLPFRSGYLHTVTQEYGANYHAYKALLETMHPLPTAFFENTSACGLQDDDFEDYGHLTEAGAEKFTKYFAGWLRIGHPELVPNPAASR